MIEWICVYSSPSITYFEVYINDKLIAFVDIVVNVLKIYPCLNNISNHYLRISYVLLYYEEFDADISFLSYSELRRRMNKILFYKYL